MVYELIKTSRFKAGVKLARKRGLDISLLEDVIEKLRLDQPLEAKHRNHELTGNFKGVWECHIQPDWLLLYLKDNGVLVLTLVDTGTHSDIFKK
ncbi:MAG: type II toxin-antitoxin system YafQ family toxin [Fibrobacter sp.]|jgi:mRNA interferase YafQ|uniref:type II toxin-antitoxin system YafQ family toxin n=1 Tax=Fibrobacter sp. TaxID=35828 RepID=UPI000ACAAE86|nr:type II toxin-antitoxin system YafQ family toxin [Fibrobacter sp.]MBQ9226516.1 type II toxin-antitoxin system YafQ family toxin [Fibrobacter sp.]MBR1745468.1 type II toxin-antitoxin system YafQ family toxin [Fibrobacter sp.]MBR2900494.1 type II toxin-antitoxin system YafQ family toxin [Fibrobacter sp.]